MELKKARSLLFFFSVILCSSTRTTYAKIPEGVKNLYETTAVNWDLGFKPPSKIIDLQAIPLGGGKIKLVRSAPGDDGRSNTSEHPLFIEWYEHEGYLAWGIWNPGDYLVKTYERSVERLKKYPSYKLGFNIGAQTFDYDSQHKGILTKKFRDWLKRYKGRLSIAGGDYSQPLANFIDEESLIRQFFYGLSTYKKLLDYDVTVWQTSENGNTPQLPAVLNGFGYKGAIFRTHYTAFGGVPEFGYSKCLWTGPDGSEIPAIPAYPGQYWRPGWLGIDGDIMSRYDKPWESQLPGKRKKFSPDDLIELFKEKFYSEGIRYPVATKDDDSFSEAGEALAADLEGDDRFRWCISEELFDLIPLEGKCRPDPGSFWTQMPWGALGNRIFRQIRSTVHLLLAVDALNAFATMLGTKPGDQKLLDKAWKLLLSSENHDLTICFLLKEVNEYTDEVKKLIREPMEFLCASLLEKINMSADINIIATNTTGFDAHESIEAELKFSRPVRGFKLRQGEKPIPFDVIDAAKVNGKYHKARIKFPLSVPQFGYTVVSVEKAETMPHFPSKLSIKGNTIITPYYRLSLAANGGIEKLETIGGKKIFGELPFLSALVDNVLCESSGKWEFVYKGHQYACVNEKGRIGRIPYEITLHFYSQLPIFDMEVKIDYDGRKVGRGFGPKSIFDHCDDLLLTFKPSFRPRELLLHKPYVIYPKKLGETENAGSSYFVAIPHLAAFINSGEMGYWIGKGKIGNVLFHGPRRNVSCRCIQATVGRYKFKSRVVIGNIDTPDLFAYAWLFNQPPLVAVRPQQKGQLSGKLSFLRLEGASPVSLFSRDGKIYVRAWETTGKGAKLKLESGIRKLKPRDVNFRLEGEKKFKKTLRARGIKTICLYP